MRAYFALPSLLQASLLLVLLAAPALNSARANSLEVDLAKPDVRLDVSFKGSELLLFGAKDLAGDIIVVVRGPRKDTSVRFKERIMGVWVATDEVIFAQTPAFYALASSRPIADLLPLSVLKKEKIGTEHLNLDVADKPDGINAARVKEFFAGLLRNMARKNLYTLEPGQINLVGNQLFRTDLWFPANVVVGDYAIDTYMIANGRIKSKRTTQLRVHKVGLEAQVYDFAHEQALLYGLLAIIIAVMSGWTANLVFKKRG
ncbi:MAG: TIGR02186 family protein [Rhodospirillales bacterium]|nr:TIGR02186 family protein [Rhodospirillales bacterium]